MAAEPIPILEQPAKKNLITKLNEVVAAVDHVEKKGRNEFQRYAYMKAADIARAVRGEMAKRNVLFVTTVLDKLRSTYPAKESVMQLVEVDLGYAFLDGDSGERLPSEGWFKALGEGADKGDKSSYKSMTGAIKYALRNAFLMPDEAGDPEGDESVDKEAGKIAAQAVAQRKIAAARPQAAQASRTPQNAPNSEPDPFDEALAAAGVNPDSEPDEEPSDGVLVRDVTQAKTPKGQPYMKVTLDSGLVLGCWHKSLFEYLPFAKGRVCDFVISTNKGYSNIDGIRKIGKREFVDGVPAMDVNDDPRRLEY